MKRKEIEFLVNWKQKADRKPLIVNGARQVGKTWLIKEFGKKHYTQLAYVNCELSAAFKQIFAEEFNLNRVLNAIQVETGFKPIEGETLIVFDEIQAIEGAILSLKYFNELANGYHIIAAGSLLGIALTKTSFPVGKVEFLNLYPLSFFEFLQAMEQQALLDLIISNDRDLVKSFKLKFQDLLKQYYYVGGMPEPIQDFISNKDFGRVREIQKRILFSYELDFAKHAPPSIVPRIRLLWNSIPSQLAKENKKFLYKAVKEGARAKDYELALSWLIDAGLILRVNNVSKPAIPLKAYEDIDAFKIYLVDVGLLGAMSNINANALISENSILTEFKGALTEQFVSQELIVNGNPDIYYWSNANSRVEIDFLVENGIEIIPIEVKAAENLQSKV